MAAAGERVARLHLDLPLLLGVCLLCIIGLLVLYSAGGESTALLQRQAVRMSIAFVVLVWWWQGDGHLRRPKTSRRWASRTFVPVRAPLSPTPPASQATRGPDAVAHDPTEVVCPPFR